jgi:hypothetical protein
VVLIVPGVLWWAARHRRAPSSHIRRMETGPAAVSVGRVAQKLERSGVDVPPRATIRWIAKRARDLWPAAGSAIGELAWLAERELYAADGPRYSDRATVRALWKQVRQAMRHHE